MRNPPALPSQNEGSKNYLYKIIILVLTLIFIGSIGYFLTGDQETIFDAFYMTILILTAHYHFKIEHLTFFGKILTILLIFGGICAIAYFLKWFAEFVISGKLGISFKRRFMERQIKNLKEHFIICGYGRVGEKVAEELAFENVPFVITERDEKKVREAQEKGYLIVQGDAASGEEVLKQAQIEKAKGLIIAVGNDADSVFIAVTAKALNPNTFVVARASTFEAASKLEKVGVERVALPYQIGGYQMANMALRPGVVDFLDIIVDTRHKEMVIEEIEVKKEGTFSDYLKKGTKVVALAIKRWDKSCLVNPKPGIILKTGDKLILLGTKEQLEKIKKGL